MKGVKFCTSCGGTSVELLYPNPIRDGAATHTYHCLDCNLTWHQVVGVEDLGAKYIVLKSGAPVEVPSFVLLVTDPAARVAMRAYAAATRNRKLARDVLAMAAAAERRPQDFPPPGSEGRLNAGVRCRVVRGDVVIVVDTETE